MLKYQVPTEEEFAAHTPNQRLREEIQKFRWKAGLEPHDMRILDLGCGRGMDVLWFKERGYDAYGVDVDPVPVHNGRDLFTKLGYPADTIRVNSPDGVTDFPDQTFHYIFSWQVLEHVKDLEQVAAELHRITVRGGAGFHIFPAHRHIVEKHLFMPLVHWLPKNGLRKSLISLYVWMGMEPDWEELKKATRKTRVETYFKRLNEGTHYRPPSRIKKTFERHGFEVSFENVTNPLLLKRRFFGLLAKLKGSRDLLNYLLYTFVRVELKLIRRR